jgi:hypothetical protein
MNNFRYFSTTEKRAHIQIHSEDQLIKRKIQLSSNHIISIIKNDISAEKVDAIVNPSFASLKHHEGITWPLIDKTCLFLFNNIYRHIK